MGKPTGFMDYKRAELALRAPEERIKDWQEIKTSSLPNKEALRCQAARCNDLVYHWMDDYAYARLNKTNNFPEFTSHVCPAPCEGACTAGAFGYGLCGQRRATV